MGALTLQAASLVIQDLLQRRLETLHRLPTGARHETLLRALLVEVDTAVARAATPVADPVGDLVAQHVEATRALGAVLTAQQLNPLEPTPVRAAAERLYATFVAGRLGRAHRAAARVTYADEANNKRPLFAAELTLVTPAASALLDRLIELGRAIGTALADRSAHAPPIARAPQALVREVSIALARIRRDARAALAMYDDLPSNLEVHLLGYADALAARRARRGAAEAAERAVEGVGGDDVGVGGTKDGGRGDVRVADVHVGEGLEGEAPMRGVAAETGAAATLSEESVAVVTPRRFARAAAGIPVAVGHVGVQAEAWYGESVSPNSKRDRPADCLGGPT